MRVRSLEPSDIPALLAMQREYPYPALDAPTLEMALVVVDGDDKPLCAVAAERILQLFLWCGEMTPIQKKFALQLLHEEGAAVLKAKGYSEVNAFIPPGLAVKFSKRLEKTWNWCRNWDSWCRGL
jgi:hypothetical protein